MLNKLKNFSLHAISATLTVALLVLSSGGAEIALDLAFLASGKKAPAKTASAAGEYGKITRTAEFLIGGGTDFTQHASGALTYAWGNSWSASKPTNAQATQVTLQGSNIRVLGAELDVSYEFFTGTVYRHDVLVDVEGSVTAGVDKDAGDVASRANSTTYPLTANTTGVGNFAAAHDVLGFFTTQSDSQFNNGIGVSVGVRETGTVAHQNTNAKLIITYEADIPTGAGQYLTKTIRLPLDSTNGTDSGTRNATCPISTTCSFAFNLSATPDLSLNDIVSAYIDFNATRVPSTAMSLTGTVNGGGSVALAPSVLFATTGYRTTRQMYYSIATSTLNIGASNTFSLANAAASQAVTALGGEVVITYAYDTSATSQAETIRYMLAQGSGTAAANTNISMGSVSPAPVNLGATPSAAWFRMNVPLNAASATLRSTSTVGVSNRANAFVLSLAGTRTGDTPVLIHDFTNDYASFGAVSGAYRFSTANMQISTEVFVTFTWNGDHTGARTGTISFPASQGRVNPAAVGSDALSRVARFEFAEEANKTIRSGFLATSQSRGDTSPIAAGTYSVMLDAASASIVETVTTARQYTARFLTAIPVSTWSGSDSSTKEYALNISQSNSAGDTILLANQIVVTYDVSAPGPSSRVERSLHTVEYIMGPGTDSTPRATGVQAYVGSSWGTAKASAGQKNITILGGNTRVVSAYADVSFAFAGGATIYSVGFTGDATDGVRTLTDMRFTNGPASGVTTDTFSYDSGTLTTDASTGYHRQFDVTPLLSGYSSASLAAGVSIDFGILASHTAVNRELTSVKLVVTYETDEDLNRSGTQVVTKTVRFPLSTNAQACTVCVFNYNAKIDDLDGGSGSPILSAHYEVTATDYGAGVNNATISVDGNATSSTLSRNEINNDIATVKLYFAPPINTSTGFVQNTPQVVRLTNSVAQYGTGGEVVVTYRASVVSLSSTETVILPIGQVTSNVLSTTVGSAVVNIPGTGVSVSNIWLRVQQPVNNYGTSTIGGKVGAAATTSVAYKYGAATDLVRGQGAPLIIHNLTSATSSLVGGASITASSSFSNATGAAVYLNVEAVVTYTSDGGIGGRMMRTIEYPAAMQSHVQVSGKPRASALHLRVPENMISLEHRGSFLRLHQTHTAGASGNIVVSGSSMTANLGAASSTVAEAGDLEAYAPTIQLPVSETQLFGSSIIPGGGAVPYAMYHSAGTNMEQTTGVLVLTYTEQHDIVRPGYAQSVYQIFADNDALTPASAWHPSLASVIGESAGISSSTRPVRNNESVRIRFNVGVSTTTLNVGAQTFKLEFAPKGAGSCSSIVVWSPVENSAGSSIWKGKAGAPLAGATIPSTMLSLASGVSGVLGTYEEGGVSAANPLAAAPGKYLEYDWNIMRNGAPGDTEYCFRMVRGDDVAFDAYVNYPTIWTAPYTPETLYWRWYDDAQNETPSSVSSGLGIANGTKLKLRVGLGDVAGTAGVNERYQLQWSPNEDFANYGPVHALSTCSPQYVFCYADGGGIDGASIAVSVLGQGYTNGVHVEASSTLFSAPASSNLEMEYTIVPMRQVAGQQYYFRLFDKTRGRAITASSTLGYGLPTITSQGAVMSLSIAGVDASTAIAGVTTTSTSTATSTPLGLLTSGQDTIIAQRIDATTTAQQGYRLDLKFLTNLTSSNGAVVATTTGTNAVPLAWTCSTSSYGCLGYHTTAPLLSGGSTRFTPNNTWAGPVAGMQEEIGFSDYPTSTTQYIIYRARGTDILPAGNYHTELSYIVTPVY